MQTGPRGIARDGLRHGAGDPGLRGSEAASLDGKRARPGPVSSVPGSSETSGRVGALTPQYCERDLT